MATKKITAGLMEKLAALKSQIEEESRIPAKIREMHDSIVLQKDKKTWKVYWTQSDIANELMGLAHDIAFMPREGNEARESLRPYALKVQKEMPAAAYKEYAAKEVGVDLPLYLALMGSQIGLNEDVESIYAEACNCCTQSAWEASEARRAEAKAKAEEVEAGANALAERLGLKK